MNYYSQNDTFFIKSSKILIFILAEAKKESTLFMPIPFYCSIRIISQRT